MSDGRPTFVSLFAGVGGFDVALERAGFRCVGQIELDPFCRRVLAARWPSVLRRRDVRSFRWIQPNSDGPSDTHPELKRASELSVDLLVGGFPCQDLSVAGKRAGLGGERSGLFWEIIRIAKALRPAWGLFENVPGLVSVRGGRDMALVLEGLRECWPAVGYRVLDSRHFGVAQRRRRVFFVCGPDEARVAAVLFEPESGGGDSAASLKAGAHVAASLAAGAHRAGVNEPGRRHEDDVNLVLARTLTAPWCPHYDGDTETVVTHSLRASGHDGREDGTGRGTPMVCFDPTTSLDQAPSTTPPPPLKRGSGLDSMGWAPAVAFDTTQITSAANYSNPKPGDPCHPLAAGAHAPAIASAQIVRRLTPTECERLQGFSDGWTCLDVPLDEWARDAEAAADRCRCSDSSRYRAMGNAVTVPVVEWLGRRLMAARRLLTSLPTEGHDA